MKLCFCGQKNQGSLKVKDSIKKYSTNVIIYEMIRLK